MLDKDRNSITPIEDPERLRLEACQVAAMALRFIVDVCEPWRTCKSALGVK